MVRIILLFSVHLFTAELLCTFSWKINYVCSVSFSVIIYTEEWYPLYTFVLLNLIIQALGASKHTASAIYLLPFLHIALVYQWSELYTTVPLTLFIVRWLVLRHFFLLWNMITIHEIRRSGGWFFSLAINVSVIVLDLLAGSWGTLF